MCESCENGRFQSLSSVGMHVIKRLMVNYYAARQRLCSFQVLFCLAVSVKWLPVKITFKMT